MLSQDMVINVGFILIVTLHVLTYEEYTTPPYFSTFCLYYNFSGLKEYFGANPALTSYSPSTIVDSPISDSSNAHTEFKDSEVDEEFFDAIASSDALEDEDSDDEIELPKVV